MNLTEIEQHLRTKIKGMDREGFGALIERLYKMYDRTHKNPYYVRGGRAKLELLEDSDFFDNGLFKAMQESADAVKSAPHYDFSCVTPLLGEEKNEQKMGKWEVKLMRPLAHLLICSNCGADINITAEEHLEYYKRDFRYCPHCGAKME